MKLNYPPTRKLKFTSLFVFIFLLAFTATTKLSNANKLELLINFEEPTITEENGYLQIHYNSAGGQTPAGYTSEIGKAELPVIRKFLFLPSGASVRVEVKNINQENKTIAKQIYPHQPPMPKYAPPVRNALVKDDTHYKDGDFRFESPVKVKDEFWIRGWRFCLVEFYPVDYSPQRNTLRFNKSVEVSFIFENSDLALTQKILSRYWNEEMYKLISPYILNPSLCQLTWVPPLQIGYYVIAPSSYLSAMEEFLDWKRRKGYKVFTKTPSELGGTANEIKSYLQTAYDTAEVPPAFILLVGDVDAVPAFTGVSSTPATDLDYTLLMDSDYFPDAFIGRLSISSTSQLTGLLEKILPYEKFELAGPTSWLNKACFPASNDPSYWSIAEGTHRYVIQTWLGPLGMDCDSIWGHSGGSTADITNALNEGRVIINYSGHGSETSWAGPAFYKTNVNALTNTNQYPFVISHACLTGIFSRAECFGETWIRAANKGGLAFLGASNSSYWDEDDIMEREMFDAIFEEDYYFLAGMTQKGLYAVYLSYPSSAQYYYTIYNLLGDPSLALWITPPQAISVNHPDIVSSPTDNISINVTSSGNPVENALVCITNDSTSHIAAYTNPSGETNLTIASSPGETLYVTVTGYGLIPYQGYIIAGVEGPYLSYISHIINDDRIGSSIGDSDGRADIGELIELWINVTNFGTEMAHNVEGSLTTSDLYISISRDSSIYGDISVGDTIHNAPFFIFEVSTDVPDSHQVLFNLRLTDAADSVWNLSLPIILYAPKLELLSYEIDDSSPLGDGDGYLEVDESCSLLVRLVNQGGEGAEDVAGELTSLSEELTVVNGDANFGDIISGEYSESSPQFVINVESSAEPFASYLLQLNSTDGFGRTYTETLSVRIGTAGFADDVESGPLTWTPTNWQISSYKYSSFFHSWYMGEDIFFSYPDQQTLTLTSPQFVLPDSAVLTFWHLYATEINYDTCFVYIKVGEGSWMKIANFNGLSRVFRFGSVNLGSFPGGNNAQLGFSLTSDRRVNNMGWFVDDIYVGPARDGELGAGDVYPPCGVASDSFSYRATYASLKSIEPTEAYVVVDDHPYEMDYYYGEVETGKVYRYRMALGTGTHHYYYSFTIPGRELRLPQSGYFTGPYVAEPLYRFDFGASNSEFTTAGDKCDWEWGEPTTGPSNIPYGSNVWATKLNSNYRDSSRSRLISPYMDLSELSKPVLRVFHWYSFQGTDNSVGHDGGNIKAELPGDTLVTLYPIRNYPGQVSRYNLYTKYQSGFIDNDQGDFWHYDYFDISHLAGRNNVRFYFDFGSSSRDVDVGWYINRVEIFAGGAMLVEEPPRELTLLSPYPNPFNQKLTFPLSNDELRDVSIEVFDLLGRKVWNYGGRVKEDVSWEADNFPTGLYLYKISVEGKEKRGKVILLK